MEIRKNSQLRNDPIEEPIRIQIIVPKQALEALKQKAQELETTYSEVIRALINDYMNIHRIKGYAEAFEEVVNLVKKIGKGKNNDMASHKDWP